MWEKVEILLKSKIRFFYIILRLEQNSQTCTGIFKKILEKVKMKVMDLLGLEMVVKQRYIKKQSSKFNIWIDREFGESKFNMKKFLPSYLYWVKVLIFRNKL